MYGYTQELANRSCKSACIFSKQVGGLRDLFNSVLFSICFNLKSNSIFLCSFNLFSAQGLFLNLNDILIEFYSKFFGFSEIEILFPVFSCISKHFARFGKIKGNKKCREIRSSI